MNKKLFSFMMIAILGISSLSAAEGSWFRRVGEWVSDLLPNPARVAAPQDARVQNIPAVAAVRQAPQAQPLLDPTGLLFDSIDKCYLEGVKEALRLGADVNAHNKHNRSPLHVAGAGDSIPLIKLLLAKGANPNAQNSTGSTPLHYASFKLNHEVINALLNAGADITIRDNEGLTPFKLAIACSIGLFHSAGIKEYLKLYGGTPCTLETVREAFELEPNENQDRLLQQLCDEVNTEAADQVDTKPARALALAPLPE